METMILRVPPIQFDGAVPIHFQIEPLNSAA